MRKGSSLDGDQVSLGGVTPASNWAVLLRVCGGVIDFEFHKLGSAPMLRLAVLRSDSHRTLPPPTPLPDEHTARGPRRAVASLPEMHRSEGTASSLPRRLPRGSRLALLPPTAAPAHQSPAASLGGGSQGKVSSVPLAEPAAPPASSSSTPSPPSAEGQLALRGAAPPAHEVCGDAAAPASEERAGARPVIMPSEPASRGTHLAVARSERSV